MRMLSPEILERLSELNRLATLRQGATRRSYISVASALSKSDSQLLPGTEYETPWGCCWSHERKLFDVAPIVCRELQSLADAENCTTISNTAHLELRLLATAIPHGTMFLDLETCGFAGSMIFLAGLIRSTDQGPVLTQLFARNYAEEKSVLQALWQIASNHEVLVTFNGKSFDWPAVHDRSTIHHLGRDDRHFHVADGGDPTATGPIVARMLRTHRRPLLRHVDLLHHCRRKWKSTLPNCRLQTLEQFLCGRRRREDIPGAAIPDAYHQFVRAQNHRVIHSILHHNALDLVTLFQLALRVCRDESDADEGANDAWVRS